MMMKKIGTFLFALSLALLPSASYFEKLSLESGRINYQESLLTKEKYFNLYEELIKDAKLDDEIDFSAISSETNGRGLYLMSSTKEDEHPVYYYRGKVDNNNVLFGNVCWQVVRTTEDGGIKLIYNGEAVLDGDKYTCENTNSADILTAYQSDNWNLAYAGYMFGNLYSVNKRNVDDLSKSDSDGYYKFGTTVTYDESTGYTLKTTVNGAGHDDPDANSNWRDNWEKDRETIKNHHYTCFTTSHECGAGNPVYYIVYTNDSRSAFYIELKNGETIETAINNMFANENNSLAKTAVDEWYREHMTAYTDYLDSNATFCNDRTIATYNGWDPLNGDSSQEYLYFSTYQRAVSAQPNLSCTNLNDNFSVTGNKNGNEKLQYPVGLLTSDEAILAGGKHNTNNNDYYLNNGHYYFLMSPYYFDSDSRTTTFNIERTGNLDWRDTKDTFASGHDSDPNYQYSVRPVVVLPNDAIFTTGNGTEANPYQVAAVKTHYVRYQLDGDVPSDVTVPKAILYKEGETVTLEEDLTKEHYYFKGWSTNSVTLQDNTFVMPDHDVVITGEFEPLYTVTYLIEGDMPNDFVFPLETEYRVGDVVTLDTTVGDETFDTYKFLGWTVQDVLLKDGKFVMPANNITIVGKFEKVVDEPVIDPPHTFDSLDKMLYCFVISFIGVTCSFVLLKKQNKIN